MKRKPLPARKKRGDCSERDGAEAQFGDEKMNLTQAMHIFSALWLGKLCLQSNH